MKAGSSVAAGVVLVVQEYAAHCSKMDKFAQKLFYACCPLLGSKIRILFLELFFALLFGLLFYQVLDHFLKFDFELLPLFII